MTATNIHNVLLIGGGGNLGPSILNALQSAATFKVSVLARESSKSRYPAQVTVHRIADSYPKDELLKAFSGQDAVVCALSLQNVLQQLKFIDAATETGVKWFIPAEFGANKQATKEGDRLPVYDQKDQVLEYLGQMEVKGLSWTAVATGPFVDWGIANGFLGFDIGNHQAKIYGSGDERWTGTVLWTIGVAIARLLQEPDDFRNRFVYIYSAAFSQNEILAALEKGTDRIWDVQHLTLEDEIVAGRKKLESGDRSGVLPFVLSTFYRTGMGADYTTDVEAANVALRLSDESVMSVVQKALRFSLGT